VIVESSWRRTLRVLDVVEFAERGQGARDRQQIITADAASYR
jgi:hypothetical protein